MGMRIHTLAYVRYRADTHGARKGGGRHLRYQLTFQLETCISSLRVWLKTREISKLDPLL